MSNIETIIKDFDLPKKISTLNFFEDYFKRKIDLIRMANNIDTPKSIFDIKAQDIKKIIVDDEAHITVQLHNNFDAEEIYFLKRHLIECFGTENIIIHNDDLQFK